MSKYLLLLGIFVLFLLARIDLNFPATLDEAKEAYTSFSIIETGRDTNGQIPGLFFRADNDYLATCGVCLRIPSIFIGGLGSLGVRLPGVSAGLLVLYVF